MAEHFGEDPKDLVVDAVDDRCGDGLTPTFRLHIQHPPKCP